VLVSKSPLCDMADVGCGCGVSLGHLAKHSDNMIGSKNTSESDVKQELLSCMRPLFAAITPLWATQSFTIYIMTYLCQLATPLRSEKLKRVGWRDTSNRPNERGGQEHQPGGKNIVSELVEAVRCAKSLE
jgi:hypothetical protein